MQGSRQTPGAVDSCEPLVLVQHAQVLPPRSQVLFHDGSSGSQPPASERDQSYLPTPSGGRVIEFSTSRRLSSAVRRATASEPEGIMGVAYRHD